MLTTFMGVIAMLCSWSAIQDRVKEYYAMFLLLQTGMIGVFLSLDFFLFYIFWELVLVPMYFIIGVWGGPRKLYAAIKFFLYTLAGSVLMLLGILTLYFQHFQQFGFYTFEISDLMKTGMPLTCRSGSSGRSSSASPSRSRCSRSTPGCRTRTWKLPPPVR
jgi:NADH-quinone oxidoreductase subunit M